MEYAIWSTADRGVGWSMMPLAFPDSDFNERIFKRSLFVVVNSRSFTLFSFWHGPDEHIQIRSRSIENPEQVGVAALTVRQKKPTMINTRTVPA
jgi:hypothetical protein